MKILLVTSFFPPLRTAGTEMRTLGYALEMQKLGHEVQVVCAGDWDSGVQYWNGYVDEVYQGIHVRRVNVNWALATDPNKFLYCNPIMEKQVGNWMNEWLPDIVHITSCITLSASVIQAAKHQHLPVVLTLTDYWFVCQKLNLRRGDGSMCDGLSSNRHCTDCMLWESKAYQKLRSRLPEDLSAFTMECVSKVPFLTRLRGLRGMALNIDHRRAYLKNMIGLADRVTAPSAFLGSVIEASGMTKQIHVIYSGHDLSWLASAIDRQASSQLRFGYIGQIIPVKGLDILLSSFVSANLSDAAALFVFGDGDRFSDYWQKLETLIGNLKTIQFRGSFSHDLLGDVLSTLDVLIVPSVWHENNPRVIQEAFASKTPVIASNVGGISEFVKHEVNGLLFEPGNIADLTRQLQRIVDEPDLLDRLRCGIPSVKKMEDEIDELVNLYSELLQEVQVR